MKLWEALLAGIKAGDPIAIFFLLFAAFVIFGIVLPFLFDILGIWKMYSSDGML